jgi:site-specific DNA-methyltransferase (adenine-specific)
MINQWKVITSYVAYDHGGLPGKDGTRKVFSKVEILPPGTICNETYIVVGSYDDERHAKNLATYMTTKFFRFLVAQSMYSHHITKETYKFVPQLDLSKRWDDNMLYKLFKLNQEDTRVIDSSIRSMEPKNG